MKKLTSVLLAVMLVISMCAMGVVGASAEGEETPEATYYVTGNDLLFSPSWTENADAYKMQQDQYTGIYYINLTTVGTGSIVVPDPTDAVNPKIMYKVTDGTWANSWGAEGNAPGSPDMEIVTTDLTVGSTIACIAIMFDEAAGVTTYKFEEYVPDPTATTEPAPTTDPDATTEPTTEQPTYIANIEEDEAYVAGSEGLTGKNWDAANADAKMNKDLVAGVYYKTFTNVVAPSVGFEYKVALNGTWDISYNHEGQALGLDTNATIDTSEEFESGDIIPFITIIFDPATSKPIYTFEDYVPATTAPEVTTEEPTTAPAEKPDHAIVHFWKTTDTDSPSMTREYKIGSTVEYSVRLKASDKDVAAFDLHTWFNQSGKTKENTVETEVLKVVDYDAPDANLGTMTVNLAETVDNQILMNWAIAKHLKDYDWSVEEGVLIATFQFEVMEAGEVSVWTDINKLLKNGATAGDPAIDIVAGSEIVFAATESNIVPTTTAPAEEPTTEADQPTTEASTGKLAEETTTKATGGTSSTTNNTTAGKGVSTGDSTSIALLLGVLMLAAGVVVVARKKVSQ